MLIPILTTKLFVPSLRSKNISRPRLIERLNESRDSRLTLVSAPAGFGKTTLISEWISTSRQSAAWLSLDEGDNDPTRFFTYFTAALQTISPETGAGAIAALQSPQPPSIESILTNLLNEIARMPERFILVLDDFHSIDSAAVANALSFLIEHQPQNMHLVIATREDPQLPLARLRTRGHLMELRAADLRFTPSETAEFFNRAMGLHLSVDDIAALESRTEGWIAGLQLAGLSVQGNPDASEFIHSFTGSHHFILDYLLKEVLEKQPEWINAFLLSTSILSRMCGPLCDAVAGSPSLSGAEAKGQTALEYLERANLFTIPLDNERRWYRYHHLFGNFLRQRLGQKLDSKDIAQLHIRASAWFEANDLLLEAFRHAAAANDIERAERLIEGRKMSLHLRSVSSTILDWMESLPADVLDSRPVLCVRFCTLSLMAWRLSKIEDKLLSAEAVVQKLKEDAWSRDLIGQIACARATLALTRYDPETMLAQARRGLEYLAPENNTFRFTANWAFATANLLLGDRQAAFEACQRAIAFSKKSGTVFSKILVTTILGNLQKMDNQLFQAAETFRTVLALNEDSPHPNSATTQLHLAEIYYEWNDLEAAELLGLQSLELTKQFDHMIDRFILSEAFLARVKIARGDTDGAAAILSRVEQSAHEKNYVLRLPDIARFQVIVLIHQGKLTIAEQLASQYQLPLSQAQVLIAQNNPKKALEFLEPLRLQMETRGWSDELLKAMVLQSLALRMNGDQELAEKMLFESLALAEQGGFIRIFVDEGAQMEALLKSAARKGIQPGYTSKLLQAFQQERERRAALISEELPGTTAHGESENRAQDEALSGLLTPRELEVLQLIVQGYSNQEIGTRLFLALDTVKGHNRRIYEKLQVHRRAEAIARARDLGLIQT